MSAKSCFVSTAYEPRGRMILVINCLECGKPMTRAIADYHYLEIGLDNVWLLSWPVLESECGVVVADRVRAADLVLIIARAVLKSPSRLDGDSIRFLRKSMELTAKDLADLVGVHRVEVSRWENDKVKIDSHNEFKLRREAIRRLLPERMQSNISQLVSEIFENASSDRPSIADEMLSVDPILYKEVIGSELFEQTSVPAEV